MQISWQALLFSEVFQDQPNKPFAIFLNDVTRVATVGHNARSMDAHQKAMQDLAENNWHRCEGFTLDQRLWDETVALRLSRLTNSDREQKKQLVKSAQQFAWRCQLKMYIKNIYVERLQYHYQRSALEPVRVDWQWLLYNPTEQGKHQSLLAACDAIAHRIFWNEEIARQATDAVIKKLMENQWEKLAGFEGRGSAEGYFKKVFHTQAQDFFKALYGSCQPKTWIRHAGQVMVKLFKKLCCEKVSPVVLEEHYDSLLYELRDTQNHEKQPVDELSREKVRACIRLILQKEINCQKAKVEEIAETVWVTEEQRVSPLEQEKTTGDDDSHWTEHAEIADWEGTLLAMQILIGQITQTEAAAHLRQRQQDVPASYDESIKTLSRLMSQMDTQSLARLQLSEQERLTMQYRYIHGMTLKETASQMSQSLHKAIKPHQVVYSEKNAFLKLHQLLRDK